MPDARARSIDLLNSSVQFALAFTLAFLVHELGLVLSAKWMGAADPVLFHNNMSFRMTNPLQTLAFGIGPLAALAVGVGAGALFRFAPGLEHRGRRFILWLAIHGAILFFGQAPSVAHGPDGDLARAVHFLDWPPPANRVFGIGGVLGLIGCGYLLGRAFLSLAPRDTPLGRRRDRALWLAEAIVLPAILGAVLCLPFRVPPLARAALPFTTLVGIGWSLLAAWPEPPRSRVDGVRTTTDRGALLVLALLLLVVRVLLVPGLRLG